jgi:hypothetical protein
MDKQSYTIHFSDGKSVEVTKEELDNFLNSLIKDTETNDKQIEDKKDKQS